VSTPAFFPQASLLPLRIPLALIPRLQVLERGVRGGAEVADFRAEAFQQHPVIRSAQLPDAVNRRFAQRDDGAGVGGDFPRGGEDFLDVARHAGVQGADSHIWQSLNPLVSKRSTEPLWHFCQRSGISGIYAIGPPESSHGAMDHAYTNPTRSHHPKPNQNNLSISIPKDRPQTRTKKNGDAKIISDSGA